MHNDPIILLVAINAKYIHSNLAIYSLAASAGDFRKNVILDEFTINMTKDQVLEGIYRKRPDVLCFSCYIWNISYVEAIAREYHKIAPEVPIWVGGPEVSFEVERFLQGHHYVTGVMIGEGEKTFRELCGHYVSGNGTADVNDLAMIHGLAFRDESGNVRMTEPREAFHALDDIPFCYDHLEDFQNRIIYYESSRGCPFSCSYCLSSVDKCLRFREMELVKKELDIFLENKVPQVKFVDRTFNSDRERALEIWQYIKERDNGVTNFHFEISADLLGPRELDLLASMRPRLVQLEIGVQSTNEETLLEIHRRMRLDKVKENVAIIKKAGNINQHLDLIAGLPFEGFERFRESFDEIYDLWAEQLQLGFLKVLKGSYMYEHAEEYGILYHEEPPYEVLETKWLSYEELLRIKLVEEELEIYYNSGQFDATMKVLGAVLESPFDFFESLGVFYERNGYRTMNHSRLRRCEILLEYLSSEEFRSIARGIKSFGELEDIVKESMTFDLYERENCKTRPAFAPDMKNFADKTRKVCTNGKMSHLEPFHYRFPRKNETGLKDLPKRMVEPIWICFDYEKKETREIYLLQ